MGQAQNDDPIFVHVEKQMISVKARELKGEVTERSLT
jgi:hypothetical protein